MRSFISILLLSLFLPFPCICAFASRIRLTGYLLDDRNQVVSGGTVQIWQADQNGNVSYPSGPIYWPAFQSFGTSISRVNGNFSFITVRPGKASGSELSTIDVKVDVSGTVLITRLYFADESPPYPSSQLLDLIPSNNDTVDVIAFKNITIDLKGGGNATITPSDPDALEAGSWSDATTFDSNLVDYYIEGIEYLGNPSIFTIIFDLFIRIFEGIRSYFVLILACTL